MVCQKNDNNALVVTGVAVDNKCSESGVYLTCKDKQFRLSIPTIIQVSEFSSRLKDLKPTVILSTRMEGATLQRFALTGLAIGSSPDGILVVETALDGARSGLVAGWISDGRQIGMEILEAAFERDEGPRHIEPPGSRQVSHCGGWRSFHRRR